MAAVLDYFRQTDPRFGELSDEDLTRYIGETKPEFLRDPAFLALYNQTLRSRPAAPVTSPSRGRLVPIPEGPAPETPSLKPATAWTQFPPKPPQPQEPPKTITEVTGFPGQPLAAPFSPNLTPQWAKDEEEDWRRRREEIQGLEQWRLATLDLVGDDPVKRQEVEQLFKTQVESLGTSVVAPTPGMELIGKPIGVAVNRAERVSRAAVGDLAGIPANLAGYTEFGENVAAFAKAPEEELPVETRLKEYGAEGEPIVIPTQPPFVVNPRRALSVTGRVGLAAAGVAPVAGIAAGGAALGVPAPLAITAPLAFTPEGKPDPIGILAGLGLPAVDQFGRRLASDALVNFLNRHTTVALEEMVTQPGRFAHKVVERWPMLEQRSVARALEFGGGQVANNAYLLTLQTPGIVTADNPSEAFEEALINNVGMSLLGIPEITGRSSFTEEAVRTGRLAPRREIRRIPRVPSERRLPTGTEEAPPPAPGGVPSPEGGPPAPTLEKGGPPAFPGEKGPGPDATTQIGQPPGIPPQPQGGAGGGQALPPGPGDSVLGPTPGAGPEGPAAPTPPVTPTPPAPTPPTTPTPAPPTPAPPTPPDPRAARRAELERNIADTRIALANAEEKFAQTKDSYWERSIAQWKENLRLWEGILHREFPETKPPTPPPPTPPTTPPSAPVPPAPPVPPTPAVQGDVILGKPTVIFGARESVHQARYAWIPEELLQASHEGETFNLNQRFSPLENSRRYHLEKSEQIKVLNQRDKFQPLMYVTNARQSDIGPIGASLGSDLVWRTLLGNGRLQAIRLLSPEKRAQFKQAMDDEAAIFGLPPGPLPNHILVRILAPTDVATPEGVLAANLLIDLFNAPPGQVEATDRMAVNDAAKVTFEHLRQIAMTSPARLMREWVSQLIGAGILDRNSRTQILANDAQLTNYVQQLLVQAAYQQPGILDARNNPRTPATFRGLIDAGVSFLVQLRKRGRNDLANSFTEMVTRVIQYGREYPDRKLYNLFKQVGEQAETGETAMAKMVRAIALVLEQEVEITVTERRKERKIDEEETVNNFRIFFDNLARAVRELDFGDSLFGERTEFDVIRDYLKQRLIQVRPQAVTDLLSEGVREYSPGEQEHGRSWDWRDPLSLTPGTMVVYNGQHLIFEGVRGNVRPGEEAEAELSGREQSDAVTRRELAIAGELAGAGPTGAAAAGALQRAATAAQAQAEFVNTLPRRPDGGLDWRGMPLHLMEQLFVNEFARLDAFRDYQAILRATGLQYPPARAFALQQAQADQGRIVSILQWLGTAAENHPDIIKARAELAQRWPEFRETVTKAGVAPLWRPEIRDSTWLRFSEPGNPNRWREIRVDSLEPIYSLAEDKVEYNRGDDQRVDMVRRYKKLYKLKQKGELTQAQITEMAELEKALGQEFLAFWENIEQKDVDRKERERLELEALTKARLVANPLTTQTDMFDQGDQLTLFSGREEYFPGFHVAPKPVIDNEPKVNTLIEGPRARAARRGRQLEFGGLIESGAKPQPIRGSAPRREVLTSREALLPSFFKFPNHLEPFRWVRSQLAPHQREGVNRILSAWLAHEDFGLFDGTGAGKTREELAVAHVWNIWFGKPVLIITERQAIIDDAFAKDAEILKIPIHQFKRGPIEPDQRILIATYFDVQRGDIPMGTASPFKTIIWDEAHNLRGQGLSIKAHIGNQLAATARNLFASAMPLDKPEQLWYLQSLLNTSPQVALARVGVLTHYRMRRGETEVFFTTDHNMPARLMEERLEDLFDDMYRDGMAIKREVPLDNLEVFLKVTPVTDNQIREVENVMAQAMAYYRRQGLPAYMTKAVVQMIGRQALERAKVNQAIELVHKAIRAGKQVLLYAYRAEDGRWVSGETLEVIANRLEEVYGPGSVGRLYGGGSTVAQRNYRTKILERYQNQSLKILVATPASGGTGINADDIHGDAPREVILMTPPFSALELVQLAGRVNRLTTMSKAVMHVLYTGHRIDTWNLDIIMAKIRRLKAAVKGDIGKLEPRTLAEPAQQYRYRLRLPVISRPIPQAPGEVAEPGGPMEEPIMAFGRATGAHYKYMRWLQKVKGYSAKEAVAIADKAYEHLLAEPGQPYKPLPPRGVAPVIHYGPSLTQVRVPAIKTVRGEEKIMSFKRMKMAQANYIRWLVEVKGLKPAQATELAYAAYEHLREPAEGFKSGIPTISHAGTFAKGEPIFDFLRGKGGQDRYESWLMTVKGLTPSEAEAIAAKAYEHLKEHIKQTQTPEGQKLQLEFEFATAGIGYLPAHLQAAVTTGGRTDARRGGLAAVPGQFNVYAVAFQEQLIQTGHLSIIGQHIPNIHAAAPLFKLLRDPRFETSHFLGVDVNDQVVFHYAASAGNPVVSSLLAKGDDFTVITELMRAHGAVKVYQIHNHPSGRPRPSDEDKIAGIAMHERLPGFAGMLVTDGFQYALIHADGSVTYHDWPGVKRTPEGQFKMSDDPLLTPGEGTPAVHLLNKQVLEPQAVADVGRGLPAAQGMASIIFRDSQGRARAFSHVAINDLNNVELMTKHLRATAKAVGASGAFLYLEDLAGMEEPWLLDKLINKGLFLDVIAPVGPGLMSRRVSGVQAPDEKKYWFGIRTANVKAWRVKEDQEQYQTPDEMPTKALVWQDPGSPYAPGLPRTPRLNYFPMVLGGMQWIKPVQMPELIKICKALMGDLPKLKKLPKSRGQFLGAGPGKITLDPRIFKDEIDATKTLAHEIGHLIDYLPDHYLQRGNLLGRLLTLRNFLLDRFGTVTVTNKELRDELIALAQWWKPWDPATVPPAYDAYRRSSIELYADALGVLFNSPGEMANRAPKFYREFWNHLDAKPEVKQVLFNIQDFLNKGRLSVLQERQNDMNAMFKKGEEIWMRKWEEARRRHMHWKGLKAELIELIQDVANEAEPVFAKARQAEKAGHVWPAHLDPRNIFEQGFLRDNTNHRFLSQVWEKVVKPLEAADLTVHHLGQLFLLERIFYGDRQGLANPMGWTPEVARELLMAMRLSRGPGALGPVKMDILERANRYLHNLYFQRIVEAVKVGLYNKQAFKTTLEPNKNYYAPFKVQEHLQANGTPWVIKQVGTFKEIEDPFLALLSQVLALNNMIAEQRDRVATRDLLLQHFPRDIEPAQVRGVPPHQKPVPRPDRGILKVWENGFPKYYYVDELIARTFEHDTPMRQNVIVRALDYGFRKLFYPLFITYNPSFMLLFSPLRDFERTARNIPGHWNRFRLAGRYMQQFMAARRYMKGIPDPLVNEMMANFAIGTPWDAFPVQHRPEEDKFAELLKRFHLMSDEEAKGIYAKIVGWARAPLDWIEFYGQLLNVLPKLAAYRMAKERFGMAPAGAAAEVRNYVGIPNIAKHGKKVGVMRAVIPFFNVFLQGWRSDIERATRPKTAAGWWWRWASRDGMWSVLMAMAAAGIFGELLKELFGGISEYYKTNYNVIPIGFEPGGDYGHRVKFLTIPRDETSRLLSGIAYKITKGLVEGNMPEHLTDIFDFGGQQMPGINPILVVSEKWGEYASGMQPMDGFLGRPIIPEREYMAGGWASTKPMVLWTLKETGAMNFVRWDPDANSVLELTVSATPGLNRIVRSSDYGYREAQREAQTADARLRAREILELSDQTRSLYDQYWSLRGIKEPNRTEPQRDRYEKLNVWYNSVFRPLHEQIITAKQDGETMRADTYRQALEELSKEYERFLKEGGFK